MSTPTYYITIADRIKAYRNENNLSLKEFGKLLGVSAQAVYKWEQNTCYPDIIFLPHLARILGCRVDDFFNLPIKYLANI
jgi:transcriptional regulator with XRE-family HTH domain